MNVIELTQKLIQFPSITPLEVGTSDFLISVLEPLGFICHKLEFTEDKYPTVTNLYCKFGNGAPNLCFLGHSDVVPVGDRNKWKVDPFAGAIIEDSLYGRGAVDMKSAIAAFIIAVKQFIKEHYNFIGSISLLITGDEEGVAVNGTKKVLQLLKEKGEIIDSCIVGEPTNPNKLGEMVKIGRRGSVNFQLTVNGIQGHVAYPDNADNPITKLVKILHMLKSYKFDSGNEFFQASNLEITDLQVGNEVSNVIPSAAKANFNIRYNNLHSVDGLIDLVSKICGSITDNFQLEFRPSADAFITHNLQLAEIIADSIYKILGCRPIFSTAGGTSDARFMKDYVKEIAEFGLINKTAHKVDEYVVIEDLHNLVEIYTEIIRRYFLR